MTAALRRLGGVLVRMLVLSAWTATAAADVIEVHAARLEPVEAGYALDAQFAFELSSRLDEALGNGITLSFVVEFELARPRWYWFDEKTAAERLDVRLTYLPLSQQYRLTGGSEQQSFQSLSEALRAVGRVRGWLVVGRDRVTPGSTYIAGVRMRLDTAQLPKAIVMSTLSNRDWTLASEWRRFEFVAPEREAR